MFTPNRGKEWIYVIKDFSGNYIHFNVFATHKYVATLLVFRDTKSEGYEVKMMDILNEIHEAPTDDVMG